MLIYLQYDVESAFVSAVAVELSVQSCMSSFIFKLFQIRCLLINDEIIFI